MKDKKRVLLKKQGAYHSLVHAIKIISTLADWNFPHPPQKYMLMQNSSGFDGLEIEFARFGLDWRMAKHVYENVYKTTDVACDIFDCAGFENRIVNTIKADCIDVWVIDNFDHYCYGYEDTPDNLTKRLDMLTRIQQATGVAIIGLVFNDDVETMIDERIKAWGGELTYGENDRIQERQPVCGRQGEVLPC